MVWLDTHVAQEEFFLRSTRASPIRRSLWIRTSAKVGFFQTIGTGGGSELESVRRSLDSGPAITFPRRRAGLSSGGVASKITRRSLYDSPSSRTSTDRSRSEEAGREHRFAFLDPRNHIRFYRSCMGSRRGAGLS